MINAARELEDNYEKFFDLTVVNKDIEDAYNSILEAVERLEHEEQWVPRDWVQNTWTQWRYTFSPHPLALCFGRFLWETTRAVSKVVWDRRPTVGQQF